MKLKHWALLLLSLFMLPAIWCQETNPATPPPESQDVQTNQEKEATDSDEPVSEGEAFLAKLAEGGRTMLLLLLCSIVALGCAVERFVNQRKDRIAPDGLVAKAREHWARGSFSKIEELGQEGNTLGRMLGAIARYRNSGVERVSTIAGDIASRDLKRHLQNAFPLAVVATISPLLGLFGTVIGMIGAFDKIELMGELANPSAFGGDIGKALITTGAGLAIAIFALALYHWFKSRITAFGLELEERVSMVIADWFDKPANDSEQETSK
jgi:biopolymer transport protein ExbB